jgi:hypothetical protein
MAKVNALVNSFTSGEVTPRIDARVDTTKYRTGLRTCHNFIVMPHGGVRKRGGTRFVAPCKEGATATRLVDFQFNIEQTYMLEFGYAGAGYIRFYTNGGILTESAKTISGATKANPCVITANSHGFSNGDWVLITGVAGMTELNNRHFQVANKTTHTFELSGVNSSSYTTYTGSGSVARIYEVATGFAADDIDELSFAQSADTLYIAHESHPTQKLERFGATNWTLSEVEIKNGPFRRINSDLDNTIAVAVTSVVANIQAATAANPVVITTTAAHGLSDGASVDIASVGGMTELNSKTFEVRVLSPTTLALYDERGVPIDGSGFSAYTSGGTITQADTRWGTISPGTTVTLTAFKDTFNANHVGALWRIWEPGKGTGVAQPFADNTVGSGLSSTSQYTIDAKVYGVTNLVSAVAWQAEWNYPKHAAGWVHVQDDNDAKSFDSVYLHDLSCTLEIISYSNAKTVTARVVRNHVPKSVVDDKSAFWEEGAWSEHRGYGGLLTFQEQRLWAVSNTAEPQTMWASGAGIYEDFLDGADDDRAIVVKFASDKVDKPMWILPGKIMMMGTASGEYTIGSNSQNDALTPSNTRVIKQTAWGSAPGRAVRIGSSGFFIQRGGRKIRRIGYNFESDSFIASDMMIVSEHLGQSRILDLCYQQDPDSVLWARRANGTIIGMTNEEQQEVIAWHRHSIGGTSASVIDAGVIPGDSGDELWMIVTRTIDGGTKRYVEVMTAQGIGDTEKSDFTFLDCHLTYDGAATDTVSGLNHLEGETVSILADGAVHPDVTVTAGRITLTREASIIHIGYGYTAVLETLDLEAGAQAGTAHGRPKRISNCVVRFYRSLGGRLGPSASKMDDILFRSIGDPMGSSPPLFSGFKKVEFPNGWDEEAIVRIEHDQPLPCNVLSVTVEMNVTG